MKISWSHHAVLFFVHLSLSLQGCVCLVQFSSDLKKKKKLRDKQVVAARNIALDKDNPTKELLKIYSVRDQFLSEKTQSPTTKH